MYATGKEETDLTDLPTINSEEAHQLHQKVKEMDAGVGSQPAEVISAVLSIPFAKAMCIRGAARNRARTDNSLASTLSERTEAPAKEITELYDNLVENKYTEYNQIQPKKVEQFLYEHITTDNTTSIHSFKYLPIGLVYLLKNNGYTTAESITEEYTDLTDTTHINQIEYTAKNGRQWKVNDELIQIIRRSAECKQLREKRVFNTKPYTPTLEDILDEMSDYEIGLTDQNDKKRAAVTITEAAVRAGLNEETTTDIIKCFSRAVRYNLLKGGSIEQTVTACIRIKSTANGRPIPFEELTKIANKQRSKIQTKQQLIISETRVTDDIDMEDLIVRPTDCISYTINVLPGSIDIKTVEEITDRLKQAGQTNNNPWTEVGSAIYAIMKEKDNKAYTQDTIADVVCVSCVSLRNNYRKYVKEDESIAS